MARKQQLQIDGITVDLSKGRFANTFDIADGDEKYVATDEEVVFIVVARVNSVRFAPSKGGDHVRVNALKVQEAHLVRDEQEKTKLLERHRFEYKPMPSLVDVEAEEYGEDLPVRFVGKPSEVPEETLEALSTTVSCICPKLTCPVHGSWETSDEEMQKFLETSKAIADEYDSEDVPTSRVVAEAKGMAKDDPVLARFLGL